MEGEGYEWKFSCIFPLCYCKVVFFRFPYNGKLILFFPMLNSAFIDFSDKVSSHTLSLFDLNKKCQNHQMISKSRGFTSEMLAVPEQIHSADITYIDTPGEYIGTDGLITDNPEIILVIKVADCVPVYLYEPRSQLIGLVHSGWRGTAGGIVPNTIQLMREMGANEKEISIFLGPAIGFCCINDTSFTSSTR